VNRFKADCLYGATGSGKTSQVGEAAQYIYEKFGKTTRLISADGGGYDPLEPLIKTGIIEVWPIGGWPDLIWALDAACQGWWPEDCFKVGSKLLPPSAELWKTVGLLAYEGLTSFGDGILLHLEQKKVRLSQDPAYIFTEGQGIYAGSNMSYYGFVQARLYEFVMKTQMLPVEKVLWTALEGRGEEEGTRVPQYGPSIAGKKAIGKAGQWFGNMLHLELLVEETGVDKDTKQVKLKAKRVMYLQPHADPLTKIPFHAKTRVPLAVASELAEYLDPPSLRKLYTLVDELKVKAFEKVSAAISKPEAAAVKSQQ